MQTAIGKIIQEKRKENGLKQEYMACMLKITTHSYANIERGRTDISITKLIAISVLLNIKAHVLIKLTEDLLI